MARVVVKSGFKEFGQQTVKGMRTALIEGAAATREAAEATAPRRTGLLARSFRISGIDETLNKMRIAVYAGEFYGRFVDRGTVYIRARHFMRKAGKLGAPRFKAAVERQMRRL